MGSADLTARARIRDAAIELFGKDGFHRVRMRDVAERAGVSPALVVHHFGSKDGLRQACDQKVTGELFALKDDLAGASAGTAIRVWLDDFDRFRPQLEYIARMLADDSTAGDELFAAFLAETRQLLDEQIEAGTMRDVAERDIVAVHLTLTGLAPLVMRRHFAAAMGVEELSVDLYRRSTLALMDLQTYGLYTDDRFLVMAEEALGRRIGPRSDKGEGDPNQDPDPPARRAV